MMFLRFTRLLLLLLTGVVSVTSQCMHADDGCTKCEVDWDGFNFVCPDFCGPGNTLSYIRYGTSHVSYVAQGILNGVPITVFNDRGGFPEDSDCHVSYVAQGILNGVPITIFNDRGGFRKTVIAWIRIHFWHS
jgi:hypothetical protein